MHETGVEDDGGRKGIVDEKFAEPEGCEATRVSAGDIERDILARRTYGQSAACPNAR